MTAVDIVVIDYGIGNLLSVQRGFERCGATVSVTSDHEEILQASAVVLPGVGAFRNAMKTLQDQGLIDVIYRVADQKTPLLGICLGMQLLLDESEEFGLTSGLGLIQGRVIPIPQTNTEGGLQKIPHIGWNELLVTNNSEEWDQSLLNNVSPGDSAYFVHSYMAVPDNQSNIISNCLYGGHKIPAVIRRDNITGCQFHPEKSGNIGLDILRSFLPK